MSRMVTFTAAFLVCCEFASWSAAQEPPATGIAGDGGGGPGVATSASGATLDVAKEQADRIERALNDLVDLRFVDTPLSDVIDYCANRLEINIVIDKKGLSEAAVDPSAPVTFATRKPITFESALRLILREFDLGFVVQDEVLSITSKVRAASVQTTKVYYVGDLVKSPTLTNPNFSALMNGISSTIEPESWDDNGGPGSMNPLRNRFLIVAQGHDVHRELAKFFRELREQMKVHPSHADARAPNDLFPSLYMVPAEAGDQLANAIRSTVSPMTWKDKGGDGEICILRVGTHEMDSDKVYDRLLILQTEDVHEQLIELLQYWLRGRVVLSMGGGSTGSPPIAAPTPAKSEADSKNGESK